MDTLFRCTKCGKLSNGGTIEDQKSMEDHEANCIGEKDHSNWNKDHIDLESNEYIYVERICESDQILAELNNRIVKHNSLNGICDVVMIIDTNTAEWLMGLMGEGFIMNNMGEFDNDPDSDNKMATKILHYRSSDRKAQSFRFGI